MKLKYYLRGVGVGVFFTTLIFMISLSMNQNKGSSQDLAATETVGKTVSQAEEQKSTEMPLETESQAPKAPAEAPETETTVQDSQTPAADTEQAASETPVSETPASETPVASEQPAAPQKVQVIVSPGDTSNIVAEALKTNNLVDDAVNFNKYLVDNKFDGSIYPGTYEIQPGLTYEEIARILTTK